ncbi:MAG: PIN domain-containing protein [Nitrospinae bacterium]|nr:PIN domain-containing protein [Nitrospinota bacterium]
MTTYIVDTHALVWFLEKNSKLPKTARIALLDPIAQIILPTIVLTEITFLYSKRRTTIDLPIVLSEVASSSNCIVYPLDEEVVLRIPTNLNIHDAIIVATGLLFKELMEHDVAIITKDNSIKNSNLIKTVWA